jgi:hypothetical protein
MVIQNKVAVVLLGVGQRCGHCDVPPTTDKPWPHPFSPWTLAGPARYERVVEGQERIVVIVNAGQQYWQRNEYGVWVGGGGTFNEIFCSQVRPAWRLLACGDGGVSVPAILGAGCCPCVPVRKGLRGWLLSLNPVRTGEPFLVNGLVCCQHHLQDHTSYELLVYRRVA